MNENIPTRVKRKTELLFLMADRGEVRTLQWSDTYTSANLGKAPYSGIISQCIRDSYIFFSHGMLLFYFIFLVWGYFPFAFFFFVCLFVCFVFFLRKNQTLLLMTRSSCWQEPGLAVPWEALQGPDQYTGRCSEPIIRQSIGIPMKELGEWLKELKRFATLHKEQQYQPTRFTPLIAPGYQTTKQWGDPCLQLLM